MSEQKTFRVTSQQSPGATIENAMRFAVKLTTLGYTVDSVEGPFTRDDELIFVINVSEIGKLWAE